MRFMFEEKANPQAIHTLGDFFVGRMNIERSTSNVDMAAKRRKKHKNQISGLINSIYYNA
jgi:hypothetical protein